VSILKTLLDFARSDRGEEDSMTETLAWFLRRSEGLRRHFTDLLSERLRRRGLEVALDGAHRVRTQLVEPDAGRYDLVLDEEVQDLRIVVEVKVSDWSPEPTCDPAPQGSQDQLARYLRVAAARPGRSFVVMLVRDPFAAPVSVRTHPSYIDAIFWSDLHRIFKVWLGTSPADPFARELGTEFVNVLEVRRMVTPTITPEGLASVWPYMAFHAAIESALATTRAALWERGVLTGFAPDNARRWQEDHERIGFRLPVTAALEHFAFVGVSHSRNVVVPEKPDLMVFLETPPQLDPRRRINAAYSEVERAVEALNAEGHARWKAYREGYQVVVARKSLRDVLEVEDQHRAIRDFFVGCFEGLRRTGLLQRYVDAVKGVGPETASTL
jgi:hypothetical protein